MPEATVPGSAPLCHECGVNPAAGLVGKGRAERTCWECMLEWQSEGSCMFCANDLELDVPECGVPDYCPRLEECAPDRAVRVNDPRLPPS